MPKKLVDQLDPNICKRAEFVALRNAKSADGAKLFISARTSTVRLPYERFSADVKRTCILIATTNDATFLGDFSGERRYLPVKVNSENIELPIMYDAEKFPVLETITREEHHNIVQHDFEGAIAEAVYLYENKLHDFCLPKELRSDLDFVIQQTRSKFLGLYGMEIYKIRHSRFVMLC